MADRDGAWSIRDELAIINASLVALQPTCDEVFETTKNVATMVTPDSIMLSIYCPGLDTRKKIADWLKREMRMQLASARETTIWKKQRDDGHQAVFAVLAGGVRGLPRLLLVTDQMELPAVAIGYPNTGIARDLLRKKTGIEHRVQYAAQLSGGEHLFWCDVSDELPRLSDDEWRWIPIDTHTPLPRQTIEVLDLLAHLTAESQD